MFGWHFRSGFLSMVCVVLAAVLPLALALMAAELLLLVMVVASLMAAAAVVVG